MSLFGSMFKRQPQQPAAPVDPNPFRGLDHRVSPVARWLGNPAALATAADFNAAAEQWDERHRLANSIFDPSKDAAGFGQPKPAAPELPEPSISSTNGSYPGPMDAIAAAAQGYQPNGANTAPITFSNVDLAADGSTRPAPASAPQMPQPVPAPAAPAPSARDRVQDPAGLGSFSQMFPERYARQLMRMASLGYDTSSLRDTYGMVNPDWKPSYTATDNAVVRAQNGQAKPILSWGTPHYYTDMFGGVHSSIYNPFPDVAADGGQAGDGQGSGPPMAAPNTSGAPMKPQPGARVANAPTFGPNDIVQALQVAIAEDPENPAGILSTIVNRAAVKGTSIGNVLREPNQFEVVSNGRAGKVSPQKALALMNDPTIAAIIKNGEIPAKYAGVMNFYAPAAQKALGRKAPSWDDGSGFDVGRTRFFRTPEGMAIANAAPPASAVSSQYGAPMRSDPRVQDVPLFGGFNSMTGGDGGDMLNATGPAVLSGLPQNVANTVKMLAEGKLEPPTGRAAATPYWQNVLSLANQYDPSFDAANYGIRYATRKDYTSGKSSQNLKSINTAIGHLGKLDAAIDNLGNGGIAPVNGILNSLHAGYDPDYAAKRNDFNVKKTAVIDELVRVFRGTGGNLADIQGWEKSINDSQSPQSLHAAVRGAVDLLESRIAAMADGYRMGMGREPSPDDFLNRESLQTLSRLTGMTYGDDGSGGASSVVPDVPGFRIVKVH